MVGSANNLGSGQSTGTSRSLLQRVQADDHRAWDRLVGLYAPLVLHWVRRAGVPEEDLEDVIQEVFLAVATHVGTFHRERAGDTFRGWLRTISRSKAIDHFRRRGKEPLALGSGISLVPAAEASESSVADPEPAERVLFRRGLDLIRAEFEERTWQAFWRTTVEGRPAKDVADELGMSAGAVRVAKCRVLHRLREELGDLF